MWAEERRKLSEKEEQYQAALKEAAVLRREIETLRTDNAIFRDKAASHEKTLQELLGSTSWKFTRPLRKIGDIVHGRKG